MILGFASNTYQMDFCFCGCIVSKLDWDCKPNLGEGTLKARLETSPAMYL